MLGFVPQPNLQELSRLEYTSRSIELPFLSNPEINSPPVGMGQGLIYEFVDKEGNWKLVLSGDFIALSTLHYEKWEDFRTRLSTAIDLLVQHYFPSHFTRVGLRYRDLIVRSELELMQRPWRNLFQTSILGPFIADNLPEQDFIEVVSGFACHLDDAGALLRIRYGLARKDESEELGYLIDSDFCIENNTEISDVNHVLDQFNREAGNFFRWCITEELQQALQPQPIT